MSLSVTLGTFRCVDSQLARIVIDDCPSPQMLVLTVIEEKRKTRFVTLNVPNAESKMARVTPVRISIAATVQ